MHYHQVLDTGELGGGNLYALAIAERLKAQGESAPVWIGGGGPALAETERRGLPPRSFDQNRLRGGGIRAILELGKLAWRFRREKGLVHNSSVHTYGLMSRAYSAAGIRTVAHVQIESNAESYRWAFRKPPTAIVTCAQFLVKQLEEALPAETWKTCRIVAVPNSVDVAWFFRGDRATAKRTVGAPSNRPLILMAANLAMHKGQLTAIRAMAELRTLGTDAELWLAGVERGGEIAFTARLHELVKELNLGERVKFLGQRSDMPELMRAADAFVLPSTNEGLPLTLLEAQASGLPVLAAPTAGVPEIIAHGETGFLIAADDAGGYARHLHELFRQPELGEKLLTKAFSRVIEQYTMDAMFGNLRKVYAEVMR